MILTFGIVCITWVFFRAGTLPHALSYLACLFGLKQPPIASDAIAASMYTNYHLLIFLIAAFLVWHSPTSWAFSRRITWARAAFASSLLALSVVFMWTQSENPFIYFQF